MFITLVAPLASLGLAVPGWGGLSGLRSDREILKEPNALGAALGAKGFGRTPIHAAGTENLSRCAC
jgi:hypothetical protein